MSMIGVLIDNLNKSADEWNSSNMFELAHMCRDAADTIWQLRDDLQRANTEKAALERRIDELCAEVERLRNQLHDQQDTAEHNFVRNAREYKRVCDENDKLLWLVNDMCACFRIGAEREGISKQWCYELFDTYTRKLQELGIEAHVKEDE